MNTPSYSETEKQIDGELQDTFPASDAPADGGQRTIEARQLRDEKEHQSTLKKLLGFVEKYG